VLIGVSRWQRGAGGGAGSMGGGSAAAASRAGQGGHSEQPLHPRSIDYSSFVRLYQHLHIM
jgi:hypothetical protein